MFAMDSHRIYIPKDIKLEILDFLESFRQLLGDSLCQAPKFWETPHPHNWDALAAVVSADCDACCSVHLQLKDTNRIDEGLGFVDFEAFWTFLNTVRYLQRMAGFSLGTISKNLFHSWAWQCPESSHDRRISSLSVQANKDLTPNTPRVLTGFSLDDDPWNIENGKMLHKQNEQ